MERNTIAGIATDRNEAKITLTRLADRAGVVGAVLGPLAEAGIAVDMIVQAASREGEESDITFTVPTASIHQAMAAIEARKDDIGYDEMLHDPNVAKVSIVGVGIRSNPVLAATMFKALADARINLIAVSASEIKVSALMTEDQMETAVRVLHTAFGLDSRPEEKTAGAAA